VPFDQRPLEKLTLDIHSIGSGMVVRFLELLVGRDTCEINLWYCDNEMDAISILHQLVDVIHPRIQRDTWIRERSELWRRLAIISLHHWDVKSKGVFKQLDRLLMDDRHVKQALSSLPLADRDDDRFKLQTTNGSIDIASDDETEANESPSSYSKADKLPPRSECEQCHIGLEMSGSLQMACHKYYGRTINKDCTNGIDYG
jgi:hypothetical protein